MEKLEREQVGVDLGERRDRGVAEIRISRRGQRGDFVRAEILVDERRHDPRRGLRIGNAPQVPDRVGRQTRDGKRQIEAAVARQTREKRICEAERRRGAARRNILHG